jgi:glutamate-1-semialdehyde 2,1-aminomutase
VVAGGTSRQTSFWQPYPVALTRGSGSTVWDVDGNEYLDLINNFTALIHGHAYPPVVEAVVRAAPNGWLWSASNEHQAELAELICRRVASVAAIRFCNSGSEAASLGLKLARAATGRRKVLMARFGYHGMVPEFEAGSMNRGGPDTLIGEFNDPAEFERALEREGRDIAAVFLEPMLGAGGVLVGDRAFFDRVAAATRAAGALFALDEVQTFRLAEGGLQERLALSPDLTLFGKFIGGGFPAGAVGGRAEVMELFDPDRMKVYHSGTFNGNPLSMLAGSITVRDLTGPKIDRMAELAGRLKAGLLAAAGRIGLPCSVNQTGSLLNVFLMPRAPRNAFERTDDEASKLFHLAALNHGVFFAWRGYLVLSTNMTEAMIDDAIERCGRAMADVIAELR